MAVYNYALHPTDPPPIPGWTGTVYIATGDVDNNGIRDNIYVGGVGAGPRIVVRSGGEKEWETVVDPILGPVRAPIGYNDILLSINPFGEAAAGERLGNRIAVVDRIGQSCLIYCSWMDGGGSQVAEYDTATGATRVFATFEDPDFRGGALLSTGRVVFSPMDLAVEQTDLIVTPGAGGGPRMLVYRGDDLLLNVFVTDPDYREELEFVPATFGSQLPLDVTNGRTVFGFSLSLFNGTAARYVGFNVDRSGVELFPIVYDGDDSTKWRT